MHKTVEDAGQTAVSKTGDTGKYRELPLTGVETHDQKLHQQPVAV